MYSPKFSLKIQLGNALEEIKRLKGEAKEEKITEQRSDNAGQAQSKQVRDVTNGTFGHF